MTEREHAELVEIRGLVEAMRAAQQAAQARADSPSSRAWDVATKALVPITLAVVAWGITLDRQVNSNTSGIEAAHRDVGRLDKALEALPPKWLRDVVIRLESQNAAILQRLATLEARLGQ